MLADNTCVNRMNCQDTVDVSVRIKRRVYDSSSVKC